MVLFKYYQEINLIKEFNNYLTACICPSIYARNKSFKPFPEYSHNHGGLMHLVNEANINQHDFNNWHLNKLANNYLFAFSQFRNYSFDQISAETIKNEPNMLPTKEEELLFKCLFYGGEIKNELIEKAILPALEKMFLYKLEKLWGRHYMELPHPKSIKTYPHLFIPPTGKGDVQIESKKEDSFWSIEIDTSPFTWSMTTVPFSVPVGYIPLSKIKRSIYKTPEFFKREHLLIKCDDISSSDWFFTYCDRIGSYELDVFTGGIIELDLAMKIIEITNKMIALIACLKNLKINNHQCLMMR
jgi:hypothetical protein